MRRSIGPEMRKRWQALSSKPGGKWLFSKLLGTVVPYTGTLKARIDQLQPGHCIVLLKERRAVSNHLHSVHAMALANLGEMATGLALINSLPEHARGILVGYQMDYTKKARGLLRAECRCEIPPDNSERELIITAEISDSAGDIVATANASWLVGPER